MLENKRPYFYLCFSDLLYGFESFLAANNTFRTPAILIDMSTERFKLRAAAYLLLIKDGKVLLLRRSNTGWRDGEYTLPAGHD
jgi:hypothetical protein